MDHQRSAEANEDQQRQLETTEDHWGPADTTRNDFRLTEITGPALTNRNHYWRLAETKITNSQ